MLIQNEIETPPIPRANPITVLQEELSDMRPEKPIVQEAMSNQYTT